MPRKRGELERREVYRLDFWFNLLFDQGLLFLDFVECFSHSPAGENECMHGRLESGVYSSPELHCTALHCTALQYCTAILHCIPPVIANLYMSSD